MEKSFPFPFPKDAAFRSLFRVFYAFRPGEPLIVHISLI